MATHPSGLHLAVEALEVRDQPSAFGAMVSQWFTPPRGAIRVVGGTLGQFNPQAPAPVGISLRMLPGQVMFISNGPVPGQITARIASATTPTGRLLFSNDSSSLVQVKICWVGQVKATNSYLLNSENTLLWKPPSRPGYALVTLIVKPGGSA